MYLPGCYLAGNSYLPPPNQYQAEMSVAHHWAPPSEFDRDLR